VTGSAGSISPLCMARAVSANSSPTHREFFSTSACIAASLAMGSDAPLRATLGAIGAFSMLCDPQIGHWTRPAEHCSS